MDLTQVWIESINELLFSWVGDLLPQRARGAVTSLALVVKLSEHKKSLSGRLRIIRYSLFFLQAIVKKIPLF